MTITRQKKKKTITRIITSYRQNTSVYSTTPVSPVNILFANDHAYLIFIATCHHAVTMIMVMMRYKNDKDDNDWINQNNGKDFGNDYDNDDDNDDDGNIMIMKMRMILRRRRRVIMMNMMMVMIMTMITTTTTTIVVLVMVMMTIKMMMAAATTAETTTE